MRLTHIVDAVNDGLKRGEREFGVMTGVIICGMRNINPEISYQLAELAVAYKNRGIVAFDLAGAETDHPAKKHRDAFFLATKTDQWSFEGARAQIRRSLELLVGTDSQDQALMSDAFAKLRLFFGLEALLNILASYC